MSEIELGAYYNSIESNESQRELLKKEFIEYLQRYRELRDTIFNSDDIDVETINSLTTIREEITLKLVKLYNLDKIPEVFEHEIRDSINIFTQTIGKNVNEYINDAFIFPANLKDSNIRSPIDTAISTIENLKKIQSLNAIIEPYCNSFVIGGSNAYGPFYSVKGSKHNRYRQYGLEIEGVEDSSDIDGLIVLKDFSKIEELITILHNKNLLTDIDLDRVKKFQELYYNRQVDTFSIRSNQRGVEESYHILTEEKIDEVVSFTEASKINNEIGYIRDFRPTKPSKTKKGYYRMLGLHGGPKFEFPITFTEVKDRRKSIGYISSTPTGGIRKIDDQTDYYPGVIGSFLLQMPLLPKDHNGSFRQSSEKFFENISGQTTLRNGLNIYRQARMTSGFIEKLKEVLQ